MLSVLFAGLWPFIWHMSVASLAMLACAAWAIWGPFWKPQAVYAGIAIFLTTTAYVVGVTDGEHRVKAQWDAQIVRDVTNANKDRENIERNPPSVDDHSLCNDPDNRNRTNCKL